MQLQKLKEGPTIAQTTSSEMLRKALSEKQIKRNGKGYSRKKYLGGGGKNGRRYIFLWVVDAESFQFIWVIGVRPNLITWMVGVSLCGRGRKSNICQKRDKFLSNLAIKRVEHSKLQRKRSFLFMPNRQNSNVTVEYW